MYTSNQQDIFQIVKNCFLRFFTFFSFTQYGFQRIHVSCVSTLYLCMGDVMIILYFTSRHLKKSIHLLFIQNPYCWVERWRGRAHHITISSERRSEGMCARNVFCLPYISKNHLLSMVWPSSSFFRSASFFHCKHFYNALFSSFFRPEKF